MSNYRTIYEGNLEVASGSTTNTAITWNNITGVLPPSGSTSENPEDYYFILNGTKYVCDYFLHGDTKFKAAYRINNHDAIMLEYIIATGLSNIKIRTDDGLNVNTSGSNALSFIELLPDEVKSLITMINVNGHTAHVKYEDGAFTLLEEV